jgi:hypothetical protein
MSKYVFVTRVDFEPESVTKSNIVHWSCSKTSKSDDTALVYIVGIGFAFQWKIIGDAYPDAEWKYMCQVKREKVFKEPIQFSELKDNFSREEWPVLYTHFRGLRSFAITDDVFEKIVSLR